MTASNRAEGLADLVERLRDYASRKPLVGANLCEEAAAAIQSLAAERDALQAEAVAMRAERAWRPQYRHVKRETEYQVVDHAELQMASPPRDGQLMVIYKGIGGDVWVRSFDEFHDGRFAALQPEPPK